MSQTAFDELGDEEVAELGPPHIEHAVESEHALDIAAFYADYTGVSYINISHHVW